MVSTACENADIPHAKCRSPFAETLQKYFEQFGTINACQIMRDQLGRSRGFAFLTFDNSDSVNAVMSQQHTVDGKVVRFPASCDDSVLRGS